MSEIDKVTWQSTDPRFDKRLRAFANYLLARRMEKGPRDAILSLAQRIGGLLAFDHFDKAVCLGDPLEDQCMPSHAHVDAIHLLEVDCLLELRATLPTEGDSLPPVTPEEIRNIIKSLSLGRHAARTV